MGVPPLPPVPFQVRTGAKAHPSNHQVEPDVRGKWCVGTFGAVGVLESRDANKRRGVAIERRVIVGSTSAALSSFVAAAVGVARGYDSDITVGYGGREADAKRVLESLSVLGKARGIGSPKGRRGRCRGSDGSLCQARGRGVGWGLPAGIIAIPVILVLMAIYKNRNRRPPEPWQTCIGCGCFGVASFFWVILFLTTTMYG